VDEQPSAPSGPADAAAAERRARLRQECERLLPVSLLVKPSFAPRQGLLRELSEEGVGLILDAPVEPGATLFLHLPGLRRGNSVTCQARVVYVSPLTDELWLVGCRLAAALSSVEVQKVLAERR